MFGPLMINTGIAATAVAVIAGVTGFFAVLRGSTFAAHAIPNGAFAGAAGASLDATPNIASARQRPVSLPTRASRGEGEPQE